MKQSEIAIYSETVPVSNEISTIIQAFTSLAMPYPTNYTDEILTKEPRVHQLSIQLNNCWLTWVLAIRDLSTISAVVLLNV